MLILFFYIKWSHSGENDFIKTTVLLILSRVLYCCPVSGYTFILVLTWNSHLFLLENGITFPFLLPIPKSKIMGSTQALCYFNAIQTQQQGALQHCVNSGQTHCMFNQHKKLEHVSGKSFPRKPVCLPWYWNILDFLGVQIRHLQVGRRQRWGDICNSIYSIQYEIHHYFYVI